MASGSQNMTTYLAKGLEKLITTNASNTDNLLYINTADTNITADMLGATTSIAFTRASITGAYTTGHMVWLNAADIGTPFQLVVHDSSDLYLYKRWKSSGAWTDWTKMSAGHADTAAALESNAGGTEQPIYFIGGKPAATSYALKATVNNSTSGYMAYYSENRAISGTSNIRATSAGALSIFPSGGSYRDGIRIHARSSDNTWAAIMLCGADNTGDSGTSANSWFIGNSGGNLYFGRNGTGGSGTFLRCVSDVWAWNGTASGSISGNAATATKLSNTPNNTTTFLRGDNTWTNTLHNTLYIHRDTTDWKTGAELYFTVTKDSTSGYSYIAAYQTPTATAYNQSLVIAATGSCFIGGGEGAETIHQLRADTSGTEDLFLCPDGSIRIYTGADSKTERAIFDSSSQFYPAANDTGAIGTSGHKWANMYATTFNGNLSGDATGLSKLSNADAATLNAWRGGSIAQRNAAALDDFVSSGLAKNDGIIINIPWSTSYGQQIYIDDNSWRIAHRYLNGVPESGVPNWSAWKMIVSSTGNAAQGSATQPVYVDANGQIQTCTAYDSASVNYATSSGSCSGNAATATDADKLDGRHGTGYMRSNGNDTSLGQHSPAATVKTYFLNTDKIPNSNMTAVYCNNGTEYAHIFSRTGNYGSVIRWTYANKYMWILRWEGGAWKTDDFEKMSAGYADTAGDADTVDGKHASAFLTSHQSLANYVTLDGDQTITGTKTFKKRIIAYGYNQATNLPFMTFDKPGAYSTGMGPDGTDNRIKFGPCDLAGTAWTAQSTFNSNQWFFQGSIYCTSTLKTEGDIIPAANKRIGGSGGALYIGNSGNQSWVYVQDMCSQDGQKWKIHQNGNAEFNGTFYSDDIRGEKLRMVSDWLGFYSSANAGGSRYGYIECNANRMYFRKENSSTQDHYFDFGSAMYVDGAIGCTGSITTNAALQTGSGITIRRDPSSGNCKIWFATNAAENKWRIGVDANDRFSISAYADGEGNYDFWVYNNGACYYKTSIGASSRYIKHDINLLTMDTGNIIDRMEPVSFVFNNDPRETTNLGFIYEDLVKILPEVCFHGEGGDNNLGINYTGIIPVLVKEIQNLRKRLATVETELNSYKSKT